MAGAMVAAAALAIGMAPTAASAAPKPAPPKPTAVQIVGKDVTDKIVVQPDQPKLFTTLLDEVTWLANANPQTAAPKADKLGPKYTLTVLIKNAPSQVYDLYPMAAGGPRAHRPAKQPTGKKADGWFYGRLTMSETLRVSGVPLKAKPDVVTGGIGGGIGQDISVDDGDTLAEVNQFVGDVRRLFLLNGAVLIVILFGLAGIAFTIRRRI
ncbi:hypothetical protein ACWKSP_06850 [Micromonosporaceae bacterium Da 78-11]